MALLVMIVGAFVSDVVWGSATVVFLLTTSTALLLGKTPAGRRNAARDERDVARRTREQAQAAAEAERERQAAAAALEKRRAREAARAMRRAVRELLDDLPPRERPRTRRSPTVWSRRSMRAIHAFRRRRSVSPAGMSPWTNASCVSSSR
ncbi:hypothetical protein H4K36_00730 [Streptomyces sp. DHE7-1]|nr:hypothetical protein [Streptomyces sp. DHE7-1]